MDKNEYIELMQDKLTLQNIILMRTCPPDKVLFSETSQVRRHAAVCFMCRERLTNKHDDVSISVSERSPSSGEPMPGEIWKIVPELGGWDADRYYNPPDVLILKKIDQLAYEVAQVSFDLGFYTSGEDIKVEEPGVFIQPWNIYTMAGRHLEKKSNRITPNILNRVMKRAEMDFHHLDEKSFLYIFRQTEIEVGSFFSRKSISWLMDQHESSAQEVPASLLRNHFIQKYPDSHCPDDLDDPYLFLAKSRLPDHMLARAASDEDRLSFNHVVFLGEDFEVHSSTALITRQIPDNEGLNVFVRLNRNVDDLEIHAWWEGEDTVIEPAELEFRKDKPFIKILFKHRDHAIFMKGSLVLLTAEYE